MASFDAVYVSLSTEDPIAAADRVEEALQRVGWPREISLRVAEGRSWVQLQGVYFENADALAGPLSEQLQTTAIALVVQTVSDSFAYWRFTNGKEQRCIQKHIKQEEGWEVVRGQPEPWEREIFFEDFLEDADDYMEGVILVQGQKEAERVRRLLESGRLIEGEIHPAFSTSFGVQEIGIALQLPGFEPLPWVVEREVGPAARPRGRKRRK